MNTLYEESIHSSVQHNKELWLINWIIKALDFISYKGKDKEEFRNYLIKYTEETQSKETK